MYCDWCGEEIEGARPGAKYHVPECLTAHKVALYLGNHGSWVPNEGIRRKTRALTIFAWWLWVTDPDRYAELFPE